NILLAQTIALALNVRFDEGLCDLELCRYMTTVDADPGPDGCLGNDDDSPTLSGILTFEISQSLLDYLGAGATVCDLLDLANRKLAGEANLPDATLIAGAVGAINEGFDECRFLTECGPNPPFEQATGPIDSNRDRLDNQGAGFGEGVPVKFGLFGALPNPTRAISMIRFALPEASNVRLTLYNIRGQAMKTLVNGPMEQGYKSVGLEMQGLPSGIYLYRLEATGMESGTTFRESQKVLLIQ
ncbi:MAG TPA: T9SS type A sorting domain-containing protein, partial [Candidatus Eisenbacteria bacterium]|nr:T9SS type A sorting domain-containing protein [Candidatus Eisenbacteria bacterium]